MDQGANFWALFTPGIWKGLHAVLQTSSDSFPHALRHGEMLARLLEAAEEKPPEETLTHQLLRELIGRLDQQQGTLQRIEMGIGTFGDALAKAAGSNDDGA